MDYTRILYSEISFKPAKTCNNLIDQSGAPISTQTNGHKYTNGNGNGNGNFSSPEEFQTPRHQLCDPNSIQLDWLESEKVGVGLINVGNTCFLNSVLQCLSYCPPLYNFLVKSNGGHSGQCKINQFCMLCEMEKHVKRIRSSNNGNAIKPISIVQRLKYINKSFQFGRQEDAHEFLRYIIDHMWKACLLNHNVSSKSNKIDPKIKETTIINQIFGGYHRSQVLCLTCNSRSDTFDFFMDFILDIRNSKSLEEALKKFTQPELLENENAYKCSKCRRKVTARKKFTVFKAPNVATFQLKRFDSDRIFGGKVTKFISYPEQLDLQSYMSEQNKTSIKYQLAAVLVHVGHSSNSGHYFCFIKNSNNFWYRMDDSDVSMVPVKTVLQQPAYVLFYTRKPNQSTSSKLSPITQVIDDQFNHNKTQPQQQSLSSTLQQSQPTTTQLAINKFKTSDYKSPIQVTAHDPLAPTTATNIENTTNTSFTTWQGEKSQLGEENCSKRKHYEQTECDRFNQELDQGKVKKIKFRAQEDRFTNLSKTNPFQRFTSNGYRQYNNNNNNNTNHKRDFQKHYGRHSDVNSHEFHKNKFRRNGKNKGRNFNRR